MSAIILHPCEGVGIYTITQFSRLQDDFVDIYRECFAEAPYYEEYDKQWVIDNVYNKHLDQGYMACAIADQKLVGLVCAEPLSVDIEISPYQYLLKHPNLPFSISEACYISEVAVAKNMRRRGIGTALLNQVCIWGEVRGLNYYTARTAARGSNSLHIFRNVLNAKVLDGEQSIEDFPEEISSASKHRIYIWGKLKRYMTPLQEGA